MILGKDLTYQLYEQTILNLNDFYPIFKEFASKLDKKTFESVDWAE